MMNFSDTKQRVLVMDDDPLIRLLSLIMLEECGYDVYLTKTGEEAIDQYKRAKDRGAPFDIVILDLNNPNGMGGTATIRDLRDIDPDVRALVASGDANDPAINDYKRYGFCGALQKPFTVKDLSLVLHTVQDEKKIDGCHGVDERARS